MSSEKIYNQEEQALRVNKAIGVDISLNVSTAEALNIIANTIEKDFIKKSDIINKTNEICKSNQQCSFGSLKCPLWDLCFYIENNEALPDYLKRLFENLEKFK